MSKIVSVTTFSRSKKCSYECETHLLYPFLKALRKILRANSFEHNALRESSLFWQLSCSLPASVFILCIIFSDLFCRFSSGKKFTLTWGKISSHYLRKLFRLWPSLIFNIKIDSRWGRGKRRNYEPDRRP